MDVGYGEGKFKVIQQIPVVHEVNRTRFSPFANNVIAARSDHPDIHIYDNTRHLTRSKKSKPDLILKGHESGGYGLSWNPNKDGELLTSGEDGTVCVFNINGGRNDSTKADALMKLKNHTGVVGDCCWNNFSDVHCFSVGDDRRIVCWDTRTQRTTSVTENSHSSDIYCVNASTLDANYVVTGSKDSTIKIWDIRDLSSPVHTLLSHKNEVLQVQWSPHFANVLASSGMDRRVCIWDISKIGASQTEEEAQEGPPELLFLHGGHTNSVCDFSWNPLEPWEIASVAEDNIIQIWQMTNQNLPGDLNAP
jgi:histone-binding protein RBBP4